MLWLSRYYSYHLVYYKPSTFYRVEPISKGSIISAQPFLWISQSTSFGIRFHDNSQKSTFMCINTWLNIIIIPLFSGESSLRISSWYVSSLFLYDPSNSYLSPQNYFNRHHFFSYNSSFLFSSHTHAWACILHLKFQSVFVSFISQSLLNRF